MFSGFFLLLTVAFIVIALMALSPIGRKLLRSIQGFASGGMNDIADAIGGASPLSQAKAKIESAVEKGRQASHVVEKAAANIVTIEHSIQCDKEELHRLENRLKSAMDSGDPNGSAAGYAMRISDLEAKIDASGTALEDIKEVYERNMTLVRRFQEDVAYARKEIESLGQQLEQSSAEKDLYALTAGMANDLSFSEISEAKKKVQDQINKNRGACMAAKDLNAGREAEILDEQAERIACANRVMERYATK